MQTADHVRLPKLRRWTYAHSAALALIPALAFVAVFPLPAGAYAFGVAGPLVKFRADATPPALPLSASISAARNEFESFQIVVTGPATNVRAAASALTGSVGTIPGANIWLYREDVLNIPSSQLSAATPDDVPGLWPDALVPAIDEIYGETRNAFPFNISSGETRVIWVDVLVPGGAQSGDYSGAITLSFNEAGQIAVPVSLHVWNFTLPSTATMRTMFAFRPDAIPLGHGLSGDISAVRHDYAVLALDHRVSLSAFDDGNVAPAHIDSAYGDLLRGVAPTRLTGARLTSLVAIPSASQNVTYANWWNYFAPLGFGATTLFAYVCDEPGANDPWSKCHENAVAAHAVSPQFPTLVTTDIASAQKNVGNGGFQLSDVNFITPEINVLPGDASGYQSFLASSPINQKWDYESCDTHGCYYASPTTFPTYMVDNDPVRNRALEWLSFQYGVRGELYFETAYMFTQGDPGPWVTMWAPLYTGNGDGTVFYPGVPNASIRHAQSGTISIGGTHDIPVASIRLKLIREGLEDYEYLVLDQSLGGNALSVANKIFPDPTTMPSGEQLMEQRAAIARDIESRSCGAGLTYCAGTCVDVQNDWRNCGYCGNVCTERPPNVCYNGYCSAGCPRGTSLCCDHVCHASCRGIGDWEPRCG